MEGSMDVDLLSDAGDEGADELQTVRIEDS